MKAVNNKSMRHPAYIDAATGKPVMGKEDARTVLSFLHQMPSEKIDMGLVNICLAVLGDGPVAEDRANVRRAVRTFKKRIAQRKAEEQADGRAFRHLSRHMVVALVLIGCLLLAAVCYALGWLPWVFSFSENKDMYTFEIYGDVEMQTEPYSKFLPTGLDEKLDRGLRDNKIYIPLPTWLPERFNKISDLYFDSYEASDSVFAAFVTDETPDSGLHISVEKYNFSGELVSQSAYMKDGVIFEKYTVGETMSSKSIFEADGVIFEEYTVLETTYTIFSNGDSIGAVWFVQPYECSVIGAVSLEEMYKIIDSIGNREIQNE